MAQLIGWVPLHGAGTAIPAIKRDSATETVTYTDYVSLSECVPLFPYTVLNSLPDGFSRVNNNYVRGDLSELLRYKIYNLNMDLVGGISDVYLLPGYSAPQYFYYHIYGANYDGEQFSSFVHPTANLNSTFSEQYGNMWVVITVDETGTVCGLTPILETGRVFPGGISGSLGNPTDLGIYESRDEAVANSGSSPYNPGGNSGPAGGGGMFGDDRINDDLRPLIPSGSVENDLVDAGIFTRYLVTNAQLKEFAKVLFTDSFFSALIKELVELTFGKVYDALISVISYPFAVGELPNITLSAGDIHLGAYDTDVASTGILDKSFSQINWGNVDINEYWGNFLDYAPHTKIQLFLPWGTGFVDVDPNECMGTYLNVVTNIELSKGTCVHVVSTGNGAILGTYNGFCGSQYPITAVDTSGKAISTVLGAVSAATSIGAGALGKGAAKSADIAASNRPTPVGLTFEERLAYQKKAGQAAAIAAAKPYQAIAKASAATAATSSLAAVRLPIHFSRNGSFAANAAGMMPQKPFIIMTWPDQSVPSQYGSHVGYPSNIYENLGRLRGYTEVGAVHLDGINCTEHEREEIMSLLQGGVIL